MMAGKSSLAAFVTAGTTAGTISMGTALGVAVIREAAMEEAFTVEDTDTVAEGMEVGTDIKLEGKITCYTQLRSYC
jgi:hypothetical protein